MNEWQNQQKIHDFCLVSNQQNWIQLNRIYTTILIIIIQKETSKIKKTKR